MSIISRISRAARGAFAGWLDDADLTRATVRVVDEANQGRYVQVPFGELVQRYSGYVKVAAARNGAAVANLKLSVYRVKTKGEGRSAWKTRGIDDRRRERILRTASQSVARSIQPEDDLEEITDPLHPAVSLFRQVNPRDNGYDLIEGTSIGLDLLGNHGWAAVMGANRWPVELWPISFKYARVIPDRDKFISGYVYGTARENEETIPAEQFAHFRTPNPLGDPYYGMGCLAACVAQADLMTAFAQHALSAIDNGCQPGLVINVPGADPKTRAQAEAELNRKLRGPSKAMRSVVMGLPKDSIINNWTPNQREIAFLQSARDVREVIANCFDIPVPLMTTDTGALAQAQAAIPFWQKFGIIPRKRRMEDKINERIAPMFAELGETLVFCLESPHGEDRKAEVDEAEQLLRMGVISKESAAIRLGEDPEDVQEDPIEISIGDVPDQPQASGAEAAAPPAAGGAVVQDTALNGAQVQALSELAQSVAAGQLPLETAKAIASAAFPLVKPEQIAAMFAPLASFEPKQDAPAQDAAPADNAQRHAAGCDCCKTKRTSDLLWDRHEHVQRDDRPRTPDHAEIVQTEKHMTSALRRWFGFIGPMVIEAANLETGAVDLSLEDSPEAVDAYHQATAGKLARISIVGFNRGATDTEPKGGAVEKIQTLSERAAEKLRSRGQRVIASIGESLSERVRNSLAEGIQAGENVTQLTDRVRTETGMGADWAAERIARTETMRAYCGSRRDAWKESGVVTGRQWLLSGDPCPLCRACAEKFNRAPLSDVLIEKGDSITSADGTVYTFDWEALDGPPGHPGCACSEGAVFGSASQ